MTTTATSKRTWEQRYTMREAMDMVLYKTCLWDALTDEAESALGLIEIECSADIRLEGSNLPELEGDFVVTFTEL